ncbi:hypothetical protein DdX_17802 [Ditylenchus destructor]|uniref:Uncharacterized protein n=1 Tax=Ditylenchus destructor TaxID=166010 RepID=A0AAD4MMD6_9BILA|nr:hypothetical protein DdX_17802 [Ditylenchus destructor]
MFKEHPRTNSRDRSDHFSNRFPTEIADLTTYQPLSGRMCPAHRTHSPRYRQIVQGTSNAQHFTQLTSSVNQGCNRYPVFLHYPVSGPAFSHYPVSGPAFCPTGCSPAVNAVGQHLPNSGHQDDVHQFVGEMVPQIMQGTEDESALYQQ